VVLGLDMRFLGGKRGIFFQTIDSTADPPFDFAQGELFGDDTKKGKSKDKDKNKDTGQLRLLDGQVDGGGLDDGASGGGYVDGVGASGEAVWVGPVGVDSSAATAA
jgi:hypothetical protein